MFDLCLGKGHNLKATDIWDCEFDILTALGCNSVKNDDYDGHNILSQETALKYGFNWNELAKQIGYETIPKTFICTSLNYLKCIMETLTKDNAWQSQKWRSYYLYINFRQIMRYHNKWRIVYFDFHGKFVKGQAIPFPKEIYPIFGLSLCFNTFLTNEYIDKNKKQQYIDYTHNMGADLLTVYKRIIKRNKWLSPSTKKYALLKLEHIKLEIGSPKILREDPILDYSSKEAYQNIRKAAHWRTLQMINLDGKSSDMDIPVIDWEQHKMVGKQSYIVNAYYTPTENSIYVPLAYLQKPFIDLDERGIEYNLAHIGYTLGHEMSHCLDDLGSKYDEKGNLHNWWTLRDRNIFNRKVRNVIKQYEQFARYDGIDMDASLSTGENLADISGLAICEEYLKDFQDNNTDIVPIRALSFHTFFVYIAIQARQKIFDEAIKAQLKTNPHPMDKYRTNCPLARLDLFRSLYNIKKKDKMYWSSTDTIW
jgi:putative endopeptidase